MMSDGGRRIHHYNLEVNGAKDFQVSTTTRFFVGECFPEDPNAKKMFVARVQAINTLYEESEWSTPEEGSVGWIVVNPMIFSILWL